MTNVRVKDPHKINPIPELSEENIRCIASAQFCGEVDESASVFGAIPLQTEVGSPLCGCLIGHAAAAFGLENPSLTELKAAAKEHLEKVSSPA